MQREGDGRRLISSAAIAVEVNPRMFSDKVLLAIGEYEAYRSGLKIGKREWQEQRESRFQRRGEG
jgi:hypothetical protein